MKHPAIAVTAWALLAGGLPIAGQCQIYVGVESHSGAVVLSNFESAQTPSLLLANPVMAQTFPRGLVAAPRRTARATAEMIRLIDDIARDSDLSPRLLHAVVAAESGYDALAVSRKGAQGLMQLMPSTARRYGARDPFSPSENVTAGAGYLKTLMARFGDDLELVLAAYNAGEQAVIQAGRRVPPYPETQAYVRRIMADLDRPALARP